MPYTLDYFKHLILEFSFWISYQTRKVDFFNSHLNFVIIIHVNLEFRGRKKGEGRWGRTSKRTFNVRAANNNYYSHMRKGFQNDKKKICHVNFFSIPLKTVLMSCKPCFILGEVYTKI